ncbi:MAG: DUF4157 domain-containing protein [Thermoanaerobaculia bacterium]
MSQRASQTSASSKPGSSTVRRPAIRTSSRETARSTGRALLELQTGPGNRATAGLLQTGILQPSLRIGPVNDRYEREADRMAERVMAGESGDALASGSLAPASVQRLCPRCDEELQREPERPLGIISEARVQRVCSECEQELEEEKEEEEEPLQREPTGPRNGNNGETGGLIGARATPALESRVASLQGRGSPLSPAQRGFFEPRFGQDLSAVRLHTGPAATDAARLARARAFTVGRDIVFGAGEHRPETRSGQKLMAHELTHVVQQTPLTARRKPVLQRQPAAAEATAASETAPRETAAAETTPAETAAPESGGEAASEVHAPGLLVEDDATEVEPDQMTKSAFMAATREAACRAADSAFAGTDNTTQGCPYIQLALRFYERKSAERIEWDLLSYSPEAANATSARDYIPLIAERVRRSAETFVETGEITGLPEGLPGRIGFLAGAASLFGGLFFKAREGGPRGHTDPRAVRARLGPGQPLAGATRSRMQSAFGRSFSGVRVHDDATASRLSDRFNARAFTVGNHVAFGSGQYRPGTPVGDALIAHELAHTVQQRVAGNSVAPLRTGAATGALERDADRAAAGASAALWGRTAARARDIARNAIPRLRSGLSIQRCPSTPSSPLKISVEAPPQKTGDCGGVFSKVRWRLPSTTRDGTVVQHVHVDYSLLETCAGDQLPTPHHPLKPLEFFEAWEVKNATIYAGWVRQRARNQGFDQFDGLIDYGSVKKKSGGKVGSKGKGKATGKVAFLPGYNEGTESGWVDGHKHSGNLPTRQTPPRGWSNAVKLDHWLSTEWKCCPLNDKSQWTKTKVDGQPK